GELAVVRDARKTADPVEITIGESRRTSQGNIRELGGVERVVNPGGVSDRSARVPIDHCELVTVIELQLRGEEPVRGNQAGIDVRKRLRGLVPEEHPLPGSLVADKSHIAFIVNGRPLLDAGEACLPGLSDDGVIVNTTWADAVLQPLQPRAESEGGAPHG